MSDVKVAVIGAGSFVFGPTMIAMLRQPGLAGVELALMDVDREALSLMAGVAKRVAGEAGGKARVTTHEKRDSALEGADFVVVCAAPQMRSRYRTDVEIIERLLPDHMITEFGGIAGIGYSLRQIAFIREVAGEVRRLCDRAWLLLVANPLPRVCQAAHMLGVKTAGFCSVSLVGYGLIHRAMRPSASGGSDDGNEPFSRERSLYAATMAGLNHFTWVLAAKELTSGKGLLPFVRQAVSRGDKLGQPRSAQLLLDTGYLPASGDAHIQDFQPPPSPRPPRHDPWHGGEDERRQRVQLLKQVAEGQAPFDKLHLAWERPGEFIEGRVTGASRMLHSLNLVNEGQIPQLPRGVFVETPATVDAKGPRAMPVDLPASLVPLCRPVAECTDALARAGLERSLSQLRRAVELDATITDKAAAWPAVDAVLETHADVLGPFD